MLRIITALVKGLHYIIYMALIALLLVAAPILAGWRPMIILSGSMEPAYPVGGVTYYRHAAFDEIDVGDVITYRIGGDTLATHRVVEIDESTNSFRTKGDENISVDTASVSYASVVGKTVPAAIPYAGYLVHYLKQWYVIAPAIALVLLDWYLTAKKEDRAAKDGPRETDRLEAG